MNPLKPKPAVLALRTRHQTVRGINAMGKTDHPGNNKVKKKRRILVADTSLLVAIFIDKKTTIYAKPGQDPAVVKQNFLDNNSHFKAVKLNEYGN